MDTYTDKTFRKARCPSATCQNDFDNRIFGWISDDGKKYCSEQCADDHTLNPVEVKAFDHKWINSKMTIPQRGHRSI